MSNGADLGGAKTAEYVGNGDDYVSVVGKGKWEEKGINVFARERDEYTCTEILMTYCMMKKCHIVCDNSPLTL